MSYYFENQNPAVMANGFNTQKAVIMTSTLSVTGALSSGAQTITGAATSTGTVTALSAGAATSGGNTSAGFAMGTALTGVYFGAGAPSITAPWGSLYLNTTGSTTSTRAYINLGGTTAWTAITTVV